MKKSTLKKENTALIVVDIQEKFIPAINELDRVIDNSIKLIKACQIMGIPIIVTEQYPRGLGKTVSRIQSVLKEYNPIEKIAFNCFDEKNFLKSLKNKKIKNLIICGIESHVCVTQTIIGALAKGYTVHLVKNAISSRKTSDYKIALERAKQEGALITSTEMIIFQLMQKAGTKEFKEIQRIIK